MKRTKRAAILNDKRSSKNKAHLQINAWATKIADNVIEEIRQISDKTMFLEAIFAKWGEPKAPHPALETLDALHFALARILREITLFGIHHAKASKNSDLLCAALRCSIGEADDAKDLIERFSDLSPDDDGFLDEFAWDTYQRMDVLDQLVTRYPEQLKAAARSMNGWPMVQYPHTRNKKRFQFISERLQLGKDYPLDATARAKYRPDTPMVRYLDILVSQLHRFRTDAEMISRWEKDETKAIQRAWCDSATELSPETISTLRACLGLPRLVKDTAKQWATSAIVPLIMTTTAKTAETCSEPALLNIWRQRCARMNAPLKSRADFKSRLLPDVVRTLRSLAREK